LIGAIQLYGERPGIILYGALSVALLEILAQLLFFQFSGIEWPTLSIMILAIINGLLTSILLETFILMRELTFVKALNTAIGMSLISMVSMEVAMNSVDFFLTGGAKLNWWIIPLMLLAGYITPLPYNYWRLKVLGKSCCG